MGYQVADDPQCLYGEVANPDEFRLEYLLRDSTERWCFYDQDPYLLLPRLAALLAVGFCLGFLARYRPRQWSALVSGLDSCAVHVIRRFHGLVFEQFPILALNELADTHFSLGPTRDML